MNTIKNLLLDKYRDYLIGLDIYETRTSLILSKIIINKDERNSGIGSKIMTDLINYADNNKQIIVLTPSSDFGGNKNRLIQFYKKFGFKKNAGQYKHFEYKEDMIRYPRSINETKQLIKQKLRENLDKTIRCNNCDWSWKESESEKEDMYICHNCGHDNSKKSINETIMQNNKIDAKKIADFVNFAKKYLNIDDNIKIGLAFSRTNDLRTTAYYDYSNGGFIKVYVKNRAIIDICRSIAHELVHHLQYIQGRLVDVVKDGEDGSEIENEANAVAGVIIRKWGKINPEVYL